MASDGTDLFQSGGTMSLHDLIELFIDDVCAGKVNETAKAYRTKLRQLERFAKDRSITRELMKGFMHDMKTRTRHKNGFRMIEGGLSPYTIKTTFQTARHFCKWLFENGHITDNIAPLIKIPNPPPPTPKAISEDTFEQLVRSAMSNVGEEWERARDVAILYYLRDTGGRVGGLVNTRLPNMDLKAGEISTVEKGRNVQLYINPPTIQAIKHWLSYRAALQPITDHLFISKRTKQGITRQGIARMLNRLAERAGVQDRRNPHSFRHAFARDFLKAGGEITQLAGIMNHSSIWVTTNYYARWNDAELRGAHAANSPINSLQTTET
jgi:site-specific recombinase XerD